MQFEHAANFYLYLYEYHQKVLLLIKFVNIFVINVFDCTSNILRRLHPTTTTTLLNEFMIERTFFKLPSCKLVASILAVTTKFLLC